MINADFIVIYGDLMGFNGIYPLVMTNIAMENDHLWWIFPLEMVIFHSYIKLPEGMGVF